MKTSTGLMIGVVSSGLFVSLAWANPAMLPKHPGYPAGQDTSPVTGQALSNDPGQLNLTVDQAIVQGASAEDAHVRQQLTEQEDTRILEKPGAGVLPKVQGPQISIEPPVSEATRVPPSRDLDREPR